MAFVHQSHEREDYLDAQRASIEAVQIGRETLEETVRQGEQLAYADRLADQTKYAVEKSARLLRGMTWSGWVANLVSKDVTVPSTREEWGVSFSYDNAPEWAAAAAQSIQNYKANVMVLEACETQEQLETCRTVCDNMFSIASRDLANLEAPTENDRFIVKRLLNDLAQLRQRQKSTQKRRQEQEVTVMRRTSNTPLVSVDHPLAKQQDQHLEIISGNLDELNSIALSLNESIGNQTKLLGSLEEKSDLNLEKSRMVARRADRLTHSKSWTLTKKTFDRCVTIRHLGTGRYLGSHSGTLVLVEGFRPDLSIFEVWLRKSGLLGLKNKYTGRWIGQTLLGSLACSSHSFSAREEWQVDEDLQKTRLLCASAGWGTGGYLTLSKKDGSLKISGLLDARLSADLWRLDSYDAN